MPVVLSKIDCSNVSTVLTITEASIITFAGSNSSSASVTPPGGEPTRISGPYQALAAGDYTLSIQGSCDTGAVTVEPMLAAGGGGGSPQSDGTSEWYVDASGDPIYVIKIYDEDTGVTTFQDPSGNPLVPGVDFFPKHDTELVTLEQELCAVVDSPPDLPNIGDPAGSLYQVGDKIKWFFVSDPQIFPPTSLIQTVWNLTQGQFPNAPFFYEYDGTVLNGVQPPSSDFGTCVLSPTITMVDNCVV